MFKSGFVTVVGRPNVGKSTLLNRIIGEKISIISDKPQTTRNKISLVYTESEFQIVFIDTPGIQMPKNSLGEVMLKTSKSTLRDVDVILFMVDHSDSIGKLDNYILGELEGIETPIIAIINKIDMLETEQIEKIKVKYKNMNRFEDVVAISALEGNNVEGLIDTIKGLLPEGPKYFPDDMITDQPERLIISEIIREKALNNLEDEIPHGVMVEIDKIEKRAGKELIDVEATLFVEKKSHKGMVIGKNGSKLKVISSQARIDIENLLGSKIYLRIWIKIADNWRKKNSKVKGFGYE